MLHGFFLLVVKPAHVSATLYLHRSHTGSVEGRKLLLRERIEVGVHGYVSMLPQILNLAIRRANGYAASYGTSFRLTTGHDISSKKPTQAVCDRPSVNVSEQS